MANTIPISEQVVLVTGSSRGLGLVIANAFRTAGAHVVLNYHHEMTSDRLHRINSQPSFQGLIENTLPPTKTCLLWKADVTAEDQVVALFELVQNYYGKAITTVVNNAMIGNFQFNGDARPKLHDLTWEQMQTQQEGFLKAALNTAQAAVPGFEASGFGRIINIGTNLLANPVVPYHDYVAGKGSLLAFTRTSAVELGPKNININMVSGGLLRTTDASAATPEAVFDQVAAMTPLRRVCTPEEIADVVVFLASPAARGMTGQELCVDGGLVMK